MAEYLVLLAHEEDTRWFQLVEGSYELIEPDTEGKLRCRMFRGLTLDGPRFWADDLSGLTAALDAGTPSDEHKAFVERWRG